MLASCGAVSRCSAEQKFAFKTRSKPKHPLIFGGSSTLRPKFRSRRTATLTKDKARLNVRILSPSGVRFVSMAAKPLPTSPQAEKQHDNAGIQKLAIHFKDASKLTITVAFVTAPEAQGLAAMTPLSSW